MCPSGTLGQAGPTKAEENLDKDRAKFNFQQAYASAKTHTEKQIIHEKVHSIYQRTNLNKKNEKNNSIDQRNP